MCVDYYLLSFFFFEKDTGGEIESTLKTRKEFLCWVRCTMKQT